jgi:hypothetical protein
VTVSIHDTHSITMLFHYAECGVLFIIMLNVVMLSVCVILLSVAFLFIIMLNVVKLSVAFYLLLC